MKECYKVEVTKTETKVSISCDICGEDVSQERLWGVHTKCELSDHSPDFNPVDMAFDFCGRCMKDKVIPLLSITFDIEPRKN